MLTSLIRIGLTRSFAPFVFEGKQTPRLDFAELEPLGLYVHIPFCRSLCPFCPYYKELYDEEQSSRYVEALLKEIDLVGQSLPSRKPVTTLYFGGGTPALLAASLGTIIKRLNRYFLIQQGVGLELHPDDITPATLYTLKQAGITLVSIGIQSFDEGCLRTIGRSGKDLMEKLSLVRSFGFSVIDVDLLFGLPGQTEGSLLCDLQTAFAEGATQVSAYPFIDFSYATNPRPPESHRLKRDRLAALTAAADRLGLERTSVWTFARPGTTPYSSVTRDFFLGFGPSAATLLQTSFKVNTFSVKEYAEALSADMLPTALTLAFTERQRAVYSLFWAAYSLRLDDRRFATVTGKRLDDMFGLELRLARRLGLLARTQHGYRLTDRASFLYHRLEQAYTTAYIDKMWNIAQQEPYPKKVILR
ncbi:coproporphyrinogen-III oxidase family protein [Gorillibacterium sp. sgz500922]|uniref:coproporphyrinogen-III oxidase family protein n=1 Tax=Gorillibacterium sp. sgz500922 TaxID=3446694 RepID=UPI003F66661F